MMKMNKINIERVIDYSNILKENEKLKLEIEKLKNIINSIKPYFDIITNENFDEECEYMKKLLDEVK